MRDVQIVPVHNTHNNKRKVYQSNWDTFRLYASASNAPKSNSFWKCIASLRKYVLGVKNSKMFDSLISAPFINFNIRRWMVYGIDADDDEWGRGPFNQKIHSKMEEKSTSASWAIPLEGSIFVVLSNESNNLGQLINSYRMKWHKTATHIRHLRRVRLQWQMAHRSVIERIREDEAEQRKKTV